MKSVNPVTPKFGTTWSWGGATHKLKPSPFRQLRFSGPTPCSVLPLNKGVQHISWSQVPSVNSGSLDTLCVVSCHLTYTLYTMFQTCFWVPRPIGTGSGNVLVPGVHRSVVLVMVNVPVGIAWYICSGVEEACDGGVSKIFLRFLRFYWDVNEYFCDLMDE